MPKYFQNFLLYLVNYEIICGQIFLNIWNLRDLKKTLKKHLNKQTINTKTNN